MTAQNAIRNQITSLILPAGASLNTLSRKSSHGDPVCHFHFNCQSRKEEDVGSQLAIVMSQCSALADISVLFFVNDVEKLGSNLTKECD